LTAPTPPSGPPRVRRAFVGALLLPLMCLVPVVCGYGLWLLQEVLGIWPPCTLLVLMVSGFGAWVGWHSSDAESKP